MASEQSSAETGRDVWLAKAYEPYSASWCDIVAETLDGAKAEIENRINERKVHGEADIEWTRKNDGYWTGTECTEIRKKALYE